MWKNVGLWTKRYFLQSKVVCFSCSVCPCHGEEATVYLDFPHFLPSIPSLQERDYTTPRLAWMWELLLSNIHKLKDKVLDCGPSSTASYRRWSYFETLSLQAQMFVTDQAVGDTTSPFSLHLLQILLLFCTDHTLFTPVNPVQPAW